MDGAGGIVHQGGHLPCVKPTQVSSLAPHLVLQAPSGVTPDQDLCGSQSRIFPNEFMQWRLSTCLAYAGQGAECVGYSSACGMDGLSVCLSLDRFSSPMCTVISESSYFVEFQCSGLSGEGQGWDRGVICVRAMVIAGRGDVKKIQRTIKNIFP